MIASKKTLHLFILLFVVAVLLNLTNVLFYVINEKSFKLLRSALVNRNESYKEPYELNEPLLHDNEVTRTHRPDGNQLTTSSQVVSDEGYDETTIRLEELKRIKDQAKRVQKSLCQNVPPGLGPLAAEETEMTLSGINDAHKGVLSGGYYKPTECDALQKVAIIVPNSGEINLMRFIYNIHRFLKRQQLEYQIFVVEAFNSSSSSNTGKLFNAGFTEAEQLRTLGWNCYIFHSPWLLPLDTRNLYRCGWRPKQLFTGQDKLRSQTNDKLDFGGAMALTYAQFTKINGFSNLYSGQDPDYNDMLKRLKAENYTLDRTTNNYGKYLILDENKRVEKINGLTFSTLAPLYLLDGLSSISYSVKTIEFNGLYTSIKVDFSPQSDILNEHQIFSKLLYQVLHSTTNDMAKLKT